MVKAYIAGKIGTPSEIETLEKIDSLCKRLGIETFLPHRDVGFAKRFEDAGKVFQADIHEGLENADLVVSSLEGLHVGAGTAWELGYAYANGIPCVAIKTDESVEDSFETLSSILVSSITIVDNWKDLEEKLVELIKRLS